ncbi:response regulator [Gloeobacter violaceus]|uniref:Two-component response regulator n=1 Tax=Gloeobacter violaceus (strain ATCC 29082 / PCC 7421) TaxID=251221 RepID=Q7NFG2_GLOVI|nr:response regulator [Gloeobacter violaceus]BAC91504.1 two-component response regulator [Gloeobacter violaceus PCC 7421]
MTDILVIEDDALVRESVLEVLEAQGFRAIGAQNGQVGLRLAEEHLPDLILCDILMPGLDGYAVLAALSDNPLTQGIPFVFLTARVAKLNWRQAMAMGADDYLPKPFTAEELLETVAIRLKKHALLRSLPDTFNTKKPAAPPQHSISHFAPNQGIPLHPDSFWQVHHGLVKLSAALVEGEPVVVGWAVAPMLFGTDAVESEVYYQASAVGRVELAKFSAQEVAASPHMAQALLSRLYQSNALLAVCGQRRADDRLRGLLLLLKREVGEPCRGGTRLRVRFTHQDLANTIGTARATVTLLLNRFKQCGWIAVESDRRLCISDALPH